MAIINNKSSGYDGEKKTGVIHLVANATITVAGVAPTSNVAVGTETVVGATIRKVWWGVADASTYWTVKRGANTVLVLNNSGFADFSSGATLGMDGTATIVLEKTGAGTGYIAVEFKKY
jgi:hypothetical protein